MGRKPKYTPMKFRTACEGYFREIEYQVYAKEIREEYDEGVKKTVSDTFLNADGQKIKITKYAVPPTLERLELKLGISDETWRNYCKNPDYSDTCEWVRLKIRAYEMEMVEVLGRDGRGVQFKLEMDERRREREALRGDTAAVQAPTMADRMKILADIARQFSEAEETPTAEDDGEED